MRNNFKFKKGYYDIIKELSDKQAGELVKGLCAYAFENKPFITKDEYLKGVFLYLKNECDIATQNGINGRKGAEKLAARQRAETALKKIAVLGGIFTAAQGDAGGESKKK